MNEYQRVLYDLVASLYESNEYADLTYETQKLLDVATELVDYKLIEEVEVQVTLTATVELPKRVVDKNEGLYVNGDVTLDVNGEDVDFEIYDFEIQ